MDDDDYTECFERLYSSDFLGHLSFEEQLQMFSGTKPGEAYLYKLIMESFGKLPSLQKLLARQTLRSRHIELDHSTIAPYLNHNKCRQRFTSYILPDKTFTRSPIKTIHEKSENNQQDASWNFNFEKQLTEQEKLKEEKLIIEILGTFSKELRNYLIKLIRRDRLSELEAIASKLPDKKVRIMRMVQIAQKLQHGNHTIGQFFF
ncbi:hypothetical protein Ciccas_007075 [Cichlidogyrus casuarinus]|uniref:Uncharacterized protein n=1 Tax=Cichlidogyrus casuarinus TaxID=1844966 RepID=A0ABD2Q468_9PLAT